MHRVKYGGWDRERLGGVGGLFLSLRIAYISNLSLLLGLEKFRLGGWVVYSEFSVLLWSKA